MSFSGEYVGLTGVRLDAAEMLACGLATHFVPSDVGLPVAFEFYVQCGTTYLFVLCLEVNCYNMSYTLDLFQV
jgi:3-hydroxyisobutyryl-CoA hydrolase